MVCALVKKIQDVLLDVGQALCLCVCAPVVMCGSLLLCSLQLW